MVPSLSIGNCLLNCLFQVVFGWHPKVRNGQIQHLESRFVVQRSQIASGLVETFFIARQENNDPNLFLTKAVIDLAMQIVLPKGHRTPKDTTGETKGQFCQGHWHGSCLLPCVVGTASSCVMCIPRAKRDTRYP